MPIIRNMGKGWHKVTFSDGNVYYVTRVEFIEGSVRYECYEDFKGHSVSTVRPGREMVGAVGHGPIPAEIDALSKGDLRVWAFYGWQSEEFRKAYKAIFAVYPKLRHHCMHGSGEIHELREERQ